MKYTPRQRLEIKGAFYYLIALSSIAVVSLTLQYFGVAGMQAILANIVVNSFNIFLAIIIYIRKRRGLRVRILPWVLGFTTTMLLIGVKYQYGIIDGWTFAIKSINTTGLLIIFVVLLSLFFQPKLFRFYSIYAIFNWGLFLYIAYINGAEFHFQSYQDGKAILTGLIFWREFSFILSISIIFIIIYRNLQSVIKYDGQSTRQTNKIIQQTKSQNTISEVIQEKTDELFQKIGSQHTLLNHFNSDMESQAARFSAMSATMEEISGASEQIATESATQVDGNVQMESIIDNFKEIRLETKHNLDGTYQDIQAVSNQSATANAHLMEVEKTVYAIKDQSLKIGQTVELIVEIADRINLLSLNASIEAARAGESGRGFAVVADEIGKLAFQTQESIKEINNVISSSSKSTVAGATVIQKTAQMMRQMISQMNQGAEKIQTLQESLLIEDRYTQIIIDQMKDNITQARKISTATDEQKVAVGTSFKAIEEVIGILDGMLIEANSMAKTSDEIYNNATGIITETKKMEIDHNIDDHNEEEISDDMTEIQDLNVAE